MDDRRPMVLAHRGFSAKYPENSALAFKKALFAGADGWECDIQKTKDGQLVVIHDGSVDRVSNRKGSIGDMTFAQVKKCRLGKSQSILSFEEMLRLLPKDKYLDLELKEETLLPADCPSIFRILKKYRGPRNMMVSSFNAALLEYFRNKIPIGLLIGENVLGKGRLRFLMKAIKLNPCFVNLPVQSLKGAYRLISLPLIGFLKSRKIQLAFWVVNGRHDLGLCLPYADILITDDPQKLKNLIARTKSG